MTPVPVPKNADLHRLGRRCIKARTRLSAGATKDATWKAVATALGLDPNAVTRAANFADAADLIAAGCGAGAADFLLSDHPRLPAPVVMQIGRTHADHQRYALAQVRADRDPFGEPPARVDPPFDPHGYAEVNSRKTRNTGTLDAVADHLLFAPSRTGRAMTC